MGRTLTGNAIDAEDLVQETLIRAWRAVEQFDGRYPRAWLFTILRHTHSSMHRRMRPDIIEDPAGATRARPAFGARPSESPEDTFIDNTLSAEVDAALSGLDPVFRTTLLLIDVNKLTYAEAAETLGVPVGTVMSRLSRARDRMRKALRSRGLVRQGGAA
ncbi:RNA polymerase sigma factor [Hoyosella altamirensis]|uniref:RNA polymerase sigma factor n=1 Tax=Hoyosella altamirensis TaxID=616997 RepID=A0A839RTZ1_9ACTN|nr:sigma-70 family RNA polymerase sigma factor [Hoyosella altamirensis]MBB3039534.1 RNA polymerase sigma-70 factor (ECF subfamily) [Hoyosella altamirensis]